MTSVCNGMLLKLFLNKFSFLSSIGSDYKTVFKIFFLTKFDLCGLTMEIFESPYFNTWRFKNLCVLKHGGLVRQNCSYFPISVFQYTEI